MATIKEELNNVKDMVGLLIRLKEIHGDHGPGKDATIRKGPAIIGPT